MALRVLGKIRFISFINHSRALSSVFVVRNHVVVQGHSGIKKQLLDVDVKKFGIRFRYRDNKGKAADEDDLENDLEEFSNDIDKKQIAKIRVQSMRCDLLLKSALSLGRNKIEQAFYEGKIRVNGKKISKKSIHCDSGDVIEMIKGESVTNPEHLSVARIEILDVKTDGEEFIYVTMKRFKNLTVDKNDMK